MSAPLPRTSLFRYGFMGLPLAMLMLPVYITIPTAYAEAGLAASIVGAVLLAARLFDAVTDPIIGILSDRTPAKWGRRRLWLFLGLPFTLAGAYLLFNIPESPSGTHLLAASLLVYVGWTMLAIPYGAWGAEISSDYHQRSRVAGWREGFGLLGTMTALTLIAFYPINIIAPVLLVLLPLALLLIMHLPEPKQPKRKTRLGLKRSMVILRRNAPFRRLITAFFLNGLANSLPATLFLLYAQRNLGASPETTGMLLLSYFAAAVLGLPLWLHLAKKYNKHRVWCGAMTAACLIFLPAFFLGAGDIIAFGLICLLSGFMLGADLALPPAMQADVIDADTAKSGENRAGLYLALWSLVTKLTTALAVGLAFPLLEWSGFDATSFDQPPEALWMLTGLYALVPVALKIASIMLMRSYSLTGDELQKLQGSIQKRA